MSAAHHTSRAVPRSWAAVCGVMLAILAWPQDSQACDDACWCEITGGTWEMLSCGHYYCGLPPDCAAVIPGCDCGPMRNFQPGAGCVQDAVCGELMVRVQVDMDASTPGLQSEITVPPCTTVVEDVAVYIYDPLAQHSLWTIGYLGGLDRGITFGHMPDANAGAVLDLLGSPHTSINPGNQGWVTHAPYFEPAFLGPEVQYFEYGADQPAVLPSAALEPAFTVDIVLGGMQPGDIFEFYLADMVTLWTGGTNGALSTQNPYALDTGGDAVPDGTRSLSGIDLDDPIPVPPAAYYVDYIDGPPGGGPAVIVVASVIGDLDEDCAVNATDLAILLSSWGPCASPGDCPADLTGDGVINAADLAALLAAWSSLPD